MTGANLLLGIDLLLIDGNNLLHRVAGSVEPTALRLLLARLRAVLPDGLRTVVMLDGMPDAGAPIADRIGRDLTVRHAGRSDADSALVALVGAQPAHLRARVVVVTDDRALADRVRQFGASPRRLAWLTGLWEPRAGAHLLRAGRGLGQGRPPRVAQPADGSAMEGVAPHASDEREPWRPGRGATAKKGNPRRARRRDPPL